MNEFQELAREFLLDARERLARMEELLLLLEEGAGARRDELLIELKRELHTVKGNAGMMGFSDLQARCHLLEDQVFTLREVEGGELAPIIEGIDGLRALLEEEASRVGQEGPSATTSVEAESPAEGAKTAGEAGNASETGHAAAASVRVPFQALDELVELLAEMVIFRNRLGDSIYRAQNHLDRENAIEEIIHSHHALAKTLNGIQERVLRLRMVPLRTLFGSLRRIVHDEAKREGKDVRFDSTGGETPIDKALLEVASEALGHLVRNAVIHGIEDPARRTASGKSTQGTVRISAASRTDDLLIEVFDDGSGIDRAALLDAARRAGLDVSDQTTVESLLLRGDLSARKVADMGSGRGVGLGAARESAERVGGSIEINTEAGRGSAFRLRLPLTVSILRTLLIVADGELYALPLANVLESVRFSESDGTEVNHALLYRWRDEVLPVLDIAASFGRPVPRRRSGFILIIQADNRKRAILADEAIGIREIVVKGLDPMVGSPAGISGSTILGDGRVVLILDPRGLVELSPFFAQVPAEKQAGTVTSASLPAAGLRGASSHERD